MFIHLQFNPVSIAHQAAALYHLKAGLAVHQTHQLPVQDAPPLCLPMDLRQFRHLGQHPHIPLVAQLRPALRIEVGYTPLSVPFHLIDIFFIRKGRHIFRDEHRGDMLFCEQIAHEALTFLRERGFFGGVSFSLAWACSTICWRASIRLMTFVGCSSGVAVISWLLALA